MKLLSRFTLVLVAALLASCAAATDSANKVTTPAPVTGKKLMVELPKSLTPSALPVAGSFSRAPGAGYTSAGYAMLYSAITMGKSFTPAMAQFGIMVDAVVSQNNLSPSGTVRSGLTVTVTQAMVDQMKAALPEGLLVATSLPPVGSMPMPDFIYNVSSNPHFAFSMTISLPGNAGTETIFWNQDKSKFGMSATMGVGASTMTFTVANDDATQSTVMNISANGLVYALKFKADPTATALHGVFVVLNYTMTSGSTVVSSLVSGYGDDKGGAVTFNTLFGTSTAVYKEVFSGLGVVTYQALTLGGTTSTNVGTPSTIYDAKLANNDWGNAVSFF